MRKTIAFDLCLLSLPCMAQYGYMGYGGRGSGGAKSPEEQEAMRQISETLQNVQYEMMSLAQGSGRWKTERPRCSEAFLSAFRSGLILLVS